MRKGGHHLLCKQKREQFRFLRLYSCCVYKKKTTHFLKHHDYLKSIDTVIRIPGEVIRSYGTDYIHICVANRPFVARSRNTESLGQGHINRDGERRYSRTTEYEYQLVGS